MAESFDPYRKWLGIPPDQQPPNHYRLLGVMLFEDDLDVIENAVNRQMAHIRTFQSGKHSADSQKILNELAAAKLCLLIPEKKDEYDATLRSQQPSSLPPVAAAPPVKPPAASPPAPVTATAVPVSAAAPPPAEAASGPPMPGSMAPKLAVKTKGGRPVRGRRRAPIIPIAIMCLIGLAGLAALVAILTKETPAGPGGDNASTANAGSPDTAAVVPPINPLDQAGSALGNTDRTNRNDDRPGRPRPIRNKLPKLGNRNGGQDENIFRPSPPVSDTNETDADTFAEFRKRSDEQRWQAAMQRAREGLATRDVDMVQRALANVETIDKTPEQLAEIERLEAMNNYLSNFRRAVTKAVARPDFEAGPVIFEAGDNRVELTASEGNQITYTYNDQPFVSRMKEIPAEHAMVIARSVLKNDEQFGLIYLATFLAFDQKFQPDGRELAKELCRKAAADGKDVTYLAEELGLSSSNAGSSNASSSNASSPAASDDATISDPDDATSNEVSASIDPASSSAAPIGTDSGDGALATEESARLAVPSDAALARARTRVRADLVKEFGRTPSTVQQHEILNKLRSDAPTVSDDAARLAAWQTAAELSLMLSDAASFSTVVEQAVTEFDFDLHDYRLGAIQQALKRTESDKSFLAEQALSAAAEAETANNKDAALELLDVAARATRARSDFAGEREIRQRIDALRANN